MPGSFPNIPLQPSPRQVAQAVNHLLNGSLHPFVELSAAPASPGEGCTYYDLTLHMARVFDGTSWQDLW